jgi:hypothetical protein
MHDTAAAFSHACQGNGRRGWVFTPPYIHREPSRKAEGFSGPGFGFSDLKFSLFLAGALGFNFLVCWPVWRFTRFTRFGGAVCCDLMVCRSCV